MALETVVARDLYYRINRTAGKSRVAYARVWDADRFLEAQRHAGAKPEKYDDKFTITPATEADYHTERTK